jgi:7,8-dihydroneopterin aldolase/epimerase/oxygenase
MTGDILISGMEFYARHGCFAEEKIIGTRFRVDLKLSADISYAAQNDDITKTVNYQSVYLEVKKIMSQPVNILENVCFKILEMVKTQFPQVINAEVTVYKLNPAIGGKVEHVSVCSKF